MVYLASFPVFSKQASTDSFSNLKAIRSGVGWVWLARLASHPRLDAEAFQLFHRWQNSLHVSQVQSSHYGRKAIFDRAMKIKTTKFNSGSLFQLFTKISSHENNPLYGMPPLEGNTSLSTTVGRAWLCLQSICSLFLSPALTILVHLWRQIRQNAFSSLDSLVSNYIVWFHVLSNLTPCENFA